MFLHQTKRKSISSNWRYWDPITADQTIALEAPFTEMEIWHAISNLGNNKSPCPHGFTSEFFKKRPMSGPWGEEKSYCDAKSHCWKYKAGCSSNPRDRRSILQSNKSLSTIKILMWLEMRLLHPSATILGLEILHLKLLVPDSMLLLDIRMLLLHSAEILIIRMGPWATTKS